MALKFLGLELGSTWKTVLRKAWSVRLIALAALLSGLEVLLPLLIWVPFDPGVFALLSFLVACAAFIARFVVQKNMIGSFNDQA